MKLLKKLRARSGETLTETLCAVLVMSLSSVLLATMISAASHMNATALEKDSALYSELTTAEEQTDIKEEGTVTVTIASNDSKKVSFPVSYYGDEDGAHTSYAVPSKGGTGG